MNEHDKTAAEAAARAAVRPPRDDAQRVGESVLDAVVASGRAAGRVAAAMAGATLAAWRTVDPELRRHILQLPMMGLTQLSPRDVHIRPLPDDGHPPVLFVHGLAGHPGNFGPMRTWFRTMGRARTYTIGFAPGLSLDAMAEQLVDAVGRIRSVNGLPHLAPVQLVAHSMGGVVCRLALLDPTFARGIERILTLGTPHAGTEAARFAATMQTLELRPDSAALARLRPALPWSGPPLTAFWSPSDLLILPPESARLEGATNVRMEGFTHYSWLIDPRMWQAAWERLAPPEDESPEPDEAAPDAAR